MRMTLLRASLPLVTLTALLFAADKARAQEDPPPQEYWKRLRIITSSLPVIRRCGTSSGSGWSDQL